MATATRSKSDAASDQSSTGKLVGFAVAGLAAGLAVNLGRKAILQGMTAARGRWSEGLKAEHAATIKIFDAIEKTTDENVFRRSMLLMQLKHALGKHAFQEENVIYPAMRDHGLAEEADALNTDHGYVKQHLFDLTETPRASVDWIAKVRTFRAELEQHVSTEEDELFPKLEALLGEEGNAHVTAAMNKEGLKIA